MEHIDAEPAEPGLGNRKVDLEIARELLELLLVHQLERGLTHHLRRQLHLIDGHDLAVDLDHDRRISREEEVRRLLVDHKLEKRFDIHRIEPGRALRSSRLLSSLIRSRSSFWESALRIASS